LEFWIASVGIRRAIGVAENRMETLFSTGEDSGADEVLDAARAHQLTAARRLGIHRAAELKEAAQKIEKLHHASVPDLSLLTARERRVLAETVRGPLKFLVSAGAPSNSIVQTSEKKSARRPPSISCARCWRPSTSVDLALCPSSSYLRSQIDYQV
jgi:hypothetical protein